MLVIKFVFIKKNNIAYLFFEIFFLFIKEQKSNTFMFWKTKEMRVDGSYLLWFLV